MPFYLPRSSTFITHVSIASILRSAFPGYACLSPNISVWSSPDDPKSLPLVQLSALVLLQISLLVVFLFCSISYLHVVRKSARNGLFPFVVSIFLDILSFVIFLLIVFLSSHFSIKSPPFYLFFFVLFQSRIDHRN